MEIKLLEIRDEGTFIPVFAFRCGARSEEERYLLARSGYGGTVRENETYVIVGKLEAPEATYDRHGWGSSRTMYNAHNHIAENWDSIKSGDVVDVEFLLGETKEPKHSERLSERLPRLPF